MGVEIRATESGGHDLASKLVTWGWRLFFIWVGIGVLVGMSPGVIMLGIGVITLGVQVARQKKKLRLETFWCVIGACFLLGGIWHLFDSQVRLAPILLTVGGLAVISMIFLPKRHA